MAYNMSLGIFLKSRFDWDTNANGVNITKYKGKDSNVVVPKEIDGKPVTSIGTRAFEGCSLEDVWYTGSRVQWENITNDYESPKYNIDQIFGNAAIHFGS